MPRYRLLVATTNPGKFREIAQVLAGMPVDLTSLNSLGTVPDAPDETGATFADNARLKAEYYAASSGLPTVAEDSGLAIDALGGRPGIHSARYPGDTYPEKFANLYAELAPHPRPWTARYVCALCFVEPAVGIRPWALETDAESRTPRAERRAPRAEGRAPKSYSCEATVEGEISPTPIGDRGFGYDPIFFYPPYDTTLGNVDDTRKLAVAHRGKAFRMFREWLESVIAR